MSKYYTPAAYAYMKKWRAAHPVEWKRICQNSQRRVIRKAKRLLGGTCVVSGCHTKTTFHHIFGDGNKHLTNRSTLTLARWILRNPVLAKARIELRCWKHHREADKAFGFMSGMRNGHHRLTDAQIREIRSRYIQGDRFHYTGPNNRQALAKEFGVTAAHISGIVHYHRWTSVLPTQGELHEV